MRRTLCDLGSLLSIIFAIGLISSVGQAVAPDGAPDDDYLLLGEFRGPISLEPNKYQAAGRKSAQPEGGTSRRSNTKGGCPANAP